MRRNMRLLPLAAALVLAGCTAKDAATDTAATDTAAATAANEVTITATDYEFESPAEIPAGLTNFKMVVNGDDGSRAGELRDRLLYS